MKIFLDPLMFTNFCILFYFFFKITMFFTKTKDKCTNAIWFKFWHARQFNRVGAVAGFFFTGAEATLRALDAYDSHATVALRPIPSSTPLYGGWSSIPPSILILRSLGNRDSKNLPVALSCTYDTADHWWALSMTQLTTGGWCQ
jgi:hypothetical protein